MKGFAFVLLCALVAVQGRHTGVESTRSAASLGENPWVVHLRIAVSTSGLLNTCAGSLIDNRWVLTAASCVSDSRFIWVRYGVVNVINPSKVTETSNVRIHPNYDADTGKNNVALISIGRTIEPSDNIRPISFGSEIFESVRFCGFGEDNSGPGEQLRCYEAGVPEDGSLKFSRDEIDASIFDIGGSLVSDGAQVALLVESDDGIAKFDKVSQYADWIGQETGLSLNAKAALEVVPEAVHFV